MINTFKIYEELSETLDDASARKLSGILGSFYEDLQNIVTKVEFNELRNTVNELAEAQKRTEIRIEALTERMDDLAEAQKRTESRVNELAEAQKRTESRVNELAEAQKRTEMRIEALTERMDQLAEAQKRTEETMQSLVGAVRECQKQIGGLSMAVGYGIEDKIIPCMEDFARKEYGISPRVIDRRNIMYSSGEFDEINIYVEGNSAEGEDVLLIGECKAQPGKRDIERFSELLERVRAHYGKPVFGFLAGYTFPPDVDTYITDHYPDIKRYMTYEFGYRFACKTA
jgi:predicted nuclease with TOPRIM domain